MRICILALFAGLAAGCATTKTTGPSGEAVTYRGPASGATALMRTADSRPYTTADKALTAGKDIRLVVDDDRVVVQANAPIPFGVFGVGVPSTGSVGFDPVTGQWVPMRPQVPVCPLPVRAPATSAEERACEQAVLESARVR